MPAWAALRKPDHLPAAILAIAVHLIFLVFLIFGVNWKTEQPEAMVVDLWSAPVASPVAEAQPAPPEPAKPEVQPPTPKADIELKERLNLKKEEQKRQETRRAEEKKAQEALRQQQIKEAAEAQRLVEEEARLARETQARQAAELARVVDEYKARIQAKIRRFIVLPPDLPPSAQTEFDVVLLPSGEVLAVKIKRSSNHKAYDDAVERAIYKAQPLPLPPDPALFSKFRELSLRFRPGE